MISLLLLFLLPPATPAARDADLPRVFLLNAKFLQQERQHAQGSAGKQSQPTKDICHEADKVITAGPFSVMHKDAVPPSGDKHDYMSLAPYFWPNPQTLNHLPYVRRDGERNPEIRQITDHDEMSKMAGTVRALALAYYLGGNEDYAARAALLLRTWFLDPATKMNPNLEYAQGIRGVSTGRGIGIIDSQGLTEVVDAVGLLNGSQNWTAADDRAIKQWFTKFLDWLRTSTHGTDESRSKNNHGSFYDLQVVDFALFVGRRDIAEQVASKAGEKRIAVQIEPDGRQPLELARTKSFSYSVFNLRALTELATLSNRVGVDLWHFETQDGRSIRRAINYLIPYASGEKAWAYRQIEPLKGSDLAEPLLQAATAYKDSRYEAEAEKLAQGSHSATVVLLQAAAKADWSKNTD